MSLDGDMTNSDFASSIRHRSTPMTPLAYLLAAAERWFVEWTGDEYAALSAPTGRAPIRDPGTSSTLAGHHNRRIPSPAERPDTRPAFRKRIRNTPRSRSSADRATVS